MHVPASAPVRKIFASAVISVTPSNSRGCVDTTMVHFACMTARRKCSGISPRIEVALIRLVKRARAQAPAEDVAKLLMDAADLALLQCGVPAAPGRRRLIMRRIKS